MIANYSSVVHEHEMAQFLQLKIHELFMNYLLKTLPKHEFAHFKPVIEHKLCIVFLS